MLNHLINFLNFTIGLYVIYARITNRDVLTCIFMNDSSKKRLNFMFCNNQLTKTLFPPSYFIFDTS